MVEESPGEKPKLGNTQREKRYNSSTNALDVIKGLDLTGKTMLITGTNSGIGTETARSLALKGAHVVMANRNEAQSAQVRDDILKEKPDAKVDLLHIDLSALESVQKAAKEFLSKKWPLHVLILNAGVYCPAIQTTQDGYERSFGVNHLAHFYLTYLLLDRLRQCAPSRIVIVSSLSHNHTGLSSSMSLDEKLQRLTEPSLSQISYRLYAYSKLCNILMAVKLHRSEFDNGIKVYSLHPGVIITGIIRDVRWYSRFFYFFIKPLCKTLQQGAATTVYCAASDDVSESSGRYFENCWDDEKYLAKELVHDEVLQDALWERSMELIKKFERSQEEKKKCKFISKILINKANSF